MKNIRKLLKYLTPYKRNILLYFVFALLTVVFSIFTYTMVAPVLQVLFNTADGTDADTSSFVGRITQHIQDFVTQYDKQTALIFVVIIIAGTTILKNLFLYLSLRILNPLKHQIIRKLRDNLYAKILSLPVGFFTEEKKGDLVSKMTNDVNEVEVSVTSVLEIIIREPITIILTLSVMLFISPQLTLFLFIFLPIVGIFIGRIGKSLKKTSNKAQEQLSLLMTNMDETIGGIRVVKAFNAERFQHLKFREINNQLFRTKNLILAKRDAASPLSETMGIIVACIIMLVGGYFIFNGKGDLTGPFFIAYLALFYQIINPLKNLSNAFFNMSKGAAALDRIQELLDTDNAIKEIDNPIACKDFGSKIEFKNVNFHYGDKQILHNINLVIEKGKTIALVGASGAGKSTLADLIPRFHDASDGEILIDGVNVKDLDLFMYRKLIGMVSQEPILFNDTIEENIQLGLGGKSATEIQEAAKIANAHNFILKKEAQYQTVVGDRGSKLSGGERQRVTIARAVLKNPPILILDEATSALDTESEQLVQKAINNLMQNRTSIVIAHRLSTIRHADEIIVMHQGHIVERGNHEQLIQIEDGFYHNLVHLQQLS